MKMDKVLAGWTSVASSTSWPQSISSSAAANKKESIIIGTTSTTSTVTPPTTIEWSNSWPIPPPAELKLKKESKELKELKESKESKESKEVKPPIEEELSRQSLYKTELCRSFSETGSCRYGHKCQFAHGEHELRAILRHPKYKTEYCKRFSTTGHCPYGSRCRFIHPGVHNGWTGTFLNPWDSDDEKDLQQNVLDDEDEIIQAQQIQNQIQEDGPARRLAIFQNLTKVDVDPATKSPMI